MSDDFYNDPHLYDLIFTSEPYARFYGEEAARANGPVLELACGTGQVLVPVARGGARVVGVDLSQPMLGRARARARAAMLSSEVEFVAGDMRTFNLNEKFAFIFIARNSLLHLHSTQDIIGCFQRVRSHLLPGGTFVFDVFNPSVSILARPAGERYPLMQVPHPDRGVVTIEATSDYDALTQVNRATWHFSTAERRDFRSSSLHLRSIFPQELPLLLAAGGFVLKERYGDFGREPFDGGSPRQVCICHA